MRELTAVELDYVAGAGEDCPGDSGNDLGGIRDSESIGDDLVNIYEGLVQVVSHVIERVATALSD